ncbi:hypothetical protein HYPSUDRAFT_202486 [Hypholoma sublateritium FD-334 SS-4]|uniref:Uncharacterized protein n=1 Tax=Hypholoma sublateritium (strain FD-334 SS-4) TaxID=945553 RepID=A0A0D2L522_HYPSF|nr:hypothetical protein HYPSUDRAFT_202486 [Hypholoma sublateritium FD-334 SS-4]
MIGAPRAHVRGHGARAVTFGRERIAVDRRTYDNEEGSALADVRPQPRARIALLLPALVTCHGTRDALGALHVVWRFTPAVLALYSRRGGTEIWRLLGALSVLQALCSQIFGPTLYGLVYMKAVARYPATIFFVSSPNRINLAIEGFTRALWLDIPDHTPHIPGLNNMSPLTKHHVGDL